MWCHLIWPTLYILSLLTNNQHISYRAENNIEIHLHHRRNRETVLWLGSSPCDHRRSPLIADTSHVMVTCDYLHVLHKSTSDFTAKHSTQLIHDNTTGNRWIMTTLCLCLFTAKPDQTIHTIQTDSLHWITATSIQATSQLHAWCLLIATW